MYHLFKRTVKLKDGKTTKKWHYWYYNTNGKQVIKACRKCKTKIEAQEFIDSLPQPGNRKNIKDICTYMFIPKSEHLTRREKLGKFLSEETIIDSRRFIEIIINLWGSYNITDLTAQIIINDLLNIDRSGSWKNRVITILKEVYYEAAWQGINAQMPTIPKFAKNYKKTDTFTTEELQDLFHEENFINYNVYCLLFICFLCGLRVSEARAIQYNQIFFKEKILLINGFCKRDGTKTSFLKKGNEVNQKWRVAVLPDIAIQLLRPFFIGYDESQAEKFIFVNDRNVPYRMEYLDDCFKKALKIANIKTGERRLIIHSLRYSYVTRMRRSVPREIVQRLAGHSSADMTDYYTKFSIADAIPGVLPASNAANMLLQL